MTLLSYACRSGGEKCFSLDLPSPRTCRQLLSNQYAGQSEVLGASDCAAVNCFNRLLVLVDWFRIAGHPPLVASFQRVFDGAEPSLEI